MEFQRAQIVTSRRGRDAGELFCVLDVRDGFLYLANGKRRKAAAPKRKNPKHVEYAGTIEHPAMARVQAGLPVRDRELRQMLAGFRDEREERRFG